MSKSSQLSVEQVKLALRVVGDCRDVGRNATAWNMRVGCFFQEHLGSVFTSCFTHRNDNAVANAQEMLCAHWSDNRYHSRWWKFVKDHGYRNYLSVQRFSERLGDGPGTFLRQDLVPNREWRNSEERKDRQAVQQDELIITAQPVRDGLFHIFSINRAHGDGAFTPREANWVRLVHEELGRLFEIRLTMKLESQPLPSDLRH